MALEIVGPIAIILSDSDIPPPPAVPPAPPLPAHWPVQNGKKYRNAVTRDDDSGHGSLFEGLPGCDLSDKEFSDEFSSSESSTRRSSASSTDPSIPPPPPVPPLPSYLQSFVLPDPQVIAVGNEPDFDPENPYGLFDFDDDLSFYEDVECIVCYDSSGSTYGFSARRKCCKRPVCRACMVNIVHVKIGEGIIHMACPNPECDAPMARKEIMECLGDNHELKERYERMKLEVEGDGSKKTCPNCSFITEHSLPSRMKRRVHESDLKITCVKCSHEWCYDCQAPWHTGITCKRYRKGNKEFQKWTKSRSGAGVANCQKCPLCRVYIQRSTGCDNMTCNRCDTHFCYKCGGRFLEIPGLGDHHTRTSVLGCQYNYKANEPVKRKALRGGYFGAKLAMLTGYPVLFVAGAVVVVAVGAVALPIYGGYKLYKYRKNAKKVQRRRRRH